MALLKTMSFFYAKIEMLYKVYEKGNVVVSYDLNDIGAECFA